MIIFAAKRNSRLILGVFAKFLGSKETFSMDIHIFKERMVKPPILPHISVQ